MMKLDNIRRYSRYVVNLPPFNSNLPRMDTGKDTATHPGPTLELVKQLVLKIQIALSILCGFYKLAKTRV